jgi:hypothetical protein
VWRTGRRIYRSGASPEDIQRLAHERWQEYRQGEDADRAREGQDKSNTQERDRDHGQDDDQGL